MSKMIDSGIEASITDELADLSAVLNVVAQLPKESAGRILRFCAAYVGDEKVGKSWTADEAYNRMKQAFAEQVAKG